MSLFAIDRGFKFKALAATVLIGSCLPDDGLAQYPPPSTNPNLELPTNGYVNAIVSLTDGSVVFGGNFATVDGVARPYLAKRSPDGTLDSTWNPAPDGVVYALATDSQGNLFVGGIFSHIGGQQRYGLAKLSGSDAGSADANWNPHPTFEVYALAVDTENNVYVGGNFNTIGGQLRSNIAKISGTGTGAADALWDPAPNDSVLTVKALAIDTSSNSVYVGGGFVSLGGQPRNGLAKLSGTGSGAADANWNPNPDGVVFSLAIDAGGEIYVGGGFATVGGKLRSHLVRLSGTGTGAADATWDPSPDNNVLALALDGTGDVYAGGSFMNIGGHTRSRLAKLSAAGTGAADANWNPGGNGDVNVLALGAGAVYAGGDFSRVGGQVRLGFAALSSAGAGAAAVATDAELPGSVGALAVQPNGGVIVGGTFYKANGIPRTHILRLASDGSLDPTWNPLADDAVYALASDASGNVYVGGLFGSVGGQTRAHVAKLSGSGAGNADTSWDAAADAPVYALTTASTGDVYAGGFFSHIGGQNRAHIAKLSGTTGSAVPGWDPSADQYVSALATNANGDVYAGGSFFNIGGQARSGIAKLDGTGTGTADATWNAFVDNPNIEAVAVDASGDVYLGGFFNTIGGQTRYGLGKVSGSGAGLVDSSWAPGTPAGTYVFALTTDQWGNVYVGGSRLLLRFSGSSPAVPDASWAPNASGPDISAIAINGTQAYVGGDAPYGGLVVAAYVIDDLFANGFEN